MAEDKLTHAERIRLEAFAQVNARNQMRPISMEAHIAEAEILEAWIYDANRSYK